MKQGVIHVIDDDDGIRRAMDRLLRSVGHEVRLYGSADEYLADQRTDELSCLVVDIRLPGTSGLEPGFPSS